MSFIVRDREFLTFKYLDMVTEVEYLKAKKVVDEYELQQKTNLQRRERRDIDLLTVLSERPRNILIAYNESECTKEGDELIYVSDVVKAIKKSGHSYKGNGKQKGKVFYAPIIRMRGMGHQSHDEIMKYVAPYL